MATTTVWRVKLRVTIAHNWHNWRGYFMYGPTPQDIRGILRRIPHCPAPLLELAAQIPDDYINRMKRNYCSSITYRAETGTISVHKKEAYVQ